MPCSSGLIPLSSDGFHYDHDTTIQIHTNTTVVMLREVMFFGPADALACIQEHRPQSVVSERQLGECLGMSGGG